ncbi:putative ubiquitin carboxyl-terminal hydrolase 5 [Smittium culicis]|uniref:Putative ubiquitin carboxyl-terminal hydrolase 5 n=1 Tax=Smittium culicis TaxID=133412 RepID=A0A1R1XL78_9FUNG|nr:putative ubiquitin carboxyl-terminal hydrolase 5 [Smittium culicis]
MSTNKSTPINTNAAYSDPVEYQRYLDRLRQLYEVRRYADIEQRALQDVYRPYPSMSLPIQNNSSFIPPYPIPPHLNQEFPPSLRDNVDSRKPIPDEINPSSQALYQPQQSQFVTKQEFSSLQGSVNQLVDLISTQLSLHNHPIPNIYPSQLQNNILPIPTAPHNLFSTSSSPPQNNVISSILKKNDNDSNSSPIKQLLYPNSFPPPSNPILPAIQTNSRSRPPTTVPEDSNANPETSQTANSNSTTIIDSSKQDEIEDNSRISVFDEEKYSDSHMEDVVSEFKTFHWKIQNWDLLEKRVVSETFVCGGHSWRVLLRPFGSSHAEIVSLFLEYANAKEAPDGWHAIAQFVLSIANSTDPTINTQGSAFHCFNKNDPNWGFTRFMKLSELVNNSFGEERPIIENGECVISAFVKVIKSPTGMPTNAKNPRSASIKEKKSPAPTS